MSRHTHIIGIGGAGMSGIARLLHERGEQVSGCDQHHSALLDQLAAQGMTTYAQHDRDHVASADRLLVTSALSEHHPEVQAARERGLPVLTRHDLWREWSLQRQTIAVAGTHGKTTTTAMLAVIFTYTEQDPGYLIGAHVPALAGAARWGSQQLIVEADEYARTFLALQPHTVVVTNINWDHVDIYESQAAYDAAFYEFIVAKSVATRIFCGDDAGLRRVCATVPAIWCGLTPDNDWQAVQIQYTPAGSRFLVRRGTTIVGSVELAVPGLHNVRNALLALVTAVQFGIDFSAAATALAQFTGSARRFEYKGSHRNITVVDDYAHHPTEIQATLAAARAAYPQQRLVVYFQPHTFSRLQAFESEFVAAFDQADIVRIGQVYGAREQLEHDPVYALIRQIQHPDVAAVGSVAAAVDHLYQLVQADDLVLTMGAGDSFRVGEQLLQRLEHS